MFTPEGGWRGGRVGRGCQVNRRLVGRRVLTGLQRYYDRQNWDGITVQPAVRGVERVMTDKTPPVTESDVL